MHDTGDPVELDALIEDPPDLSPLDTAVASTTPLDLDALLDDPLNAALVSAQLSKPSARPRKAPNPALPASSSSQPIAKPKSRKQRPKERLDALQKHLETVVDQVKLLSLRNQALHKRKHVLELLVEAIAHCELLAQQAQQDFARHRAHPEQPPTGAALYHTWTPQQYIAFFRSQNSLASRWMLEADAAVRAGRPPPQEALAQLAANHRHVLEVTFHVCQREGPFIPRVMTEMFKQFPPSMDEEAHWGQVLAVMELTDGQVEEVLVAREVFFGIISRLDRQQQAFKATIEQGTQQAEATSLDGVLNMEEELLAQITANMRQNTNMAMLLAMSIFLRTLTPLQLAKCALHAHPLFPDPVIVMNALHAKHGQAPGAPQLGPDGLPGLDSARTFQASMQLLANQPPPGLPPTTPLSAPTVIASTTLPSAHSGGSSSSSSIGPR